MKIERETFLTDLEMVRAGLSQREFIEQSSCFVFQEGEVLTFNDEIACRKDIGLDVEGAVQATALLEILGKLKEDEELAVRTNENGELEFRGKNDAFGVPKDAEIFLPIKRVEKAKEKDWTKIPKGLIEALKLVSHCVSQDESRFMLTCVHLHPEYIEACDNLQIMRVRIDTGLNKSVLVRGTSLDQVVGLGMTHLAQTESWFHFRNKKGLTLSCRQYVEQYPSLDELIKVKGNPLTLPKGVYDVTDRAAVFAADRAGDPLVAVRLSSGQIRISGRGYGGWYKGRRKIEYDGPAMRFLIAPALLQHICEKYSSAQVTVDKLKAVGKDAEKNAWTYVTVLGASEEEEEGSSIPRKRPHNRSQKRFDEEEGEEQGDEAQERVAVE